VFDDSFFELAGGWEETRVSHLDLSEAAMMNAMITTELRSGEYGGR